VIAQTTVNEKTGLLVLTRNGGKLWGRWLEAFAAQEVKPALLLVIDSASSDDSAEQARAAGFSVHTIKREDFRHGDTRRMGVEMLPGAEFIVVMTQDAVLATPDALKKMLACFADERIGAVYGRQLPWPGCDLIAAHARLFNYSETGMVKTLADVPRFGIKTAFFSNSFSVYRRTALLDAAGFPSGVIQCEDTYVAARMLLAGWKVAYCADAQVYHSHAYTIYEEFRRYFDTGVFHARERWLRETFGAAEGEGVKFVRSELRYLLRENPLLVPSAFMRTVAKLLGFRLGRSEKALPTWLKKRLSMHRNFWNDAKR